MARLIDTLTEDARWTSAGLDGLAERAARQALEALGFAPEGFQISLLGCDDARIAVLNADFRGKPVATNVLSWPSAERGAEFVGETPEPPTAGSLQEPESLGDIALAYDTCAAEARAQGKTMEDHVTHLIVHAVLHLLGYDHIEAEDAVLMEGHEVRILATLGVSDPY